MPTRHSGLIRGMRTRKSIRSRRNDLDFRVRTLRRAPRNDDSRLYGKTRLGNANQLELPFISSFCRERVFFAKIFEPARGLTSPMNIKAAPTPTGQRQARNTEQAEKELRTVPII